MQAGNIIGTGSFVPAYAKPDHQTGRSPNVTPFWGVGGAGAEVEVDTETGQFRVTKLINVADVGASGEADVDPVTEEDIRGAVWFTIPALGFLLDFARQPAGFALLIGLPAALIIFEEISKIVAAVRQEKRKREEEESEDNDSAST